MPDLTRQPSDLPKVIHFFCRRFGDHDLVRLRWGVGQNILDIQMRPANLAIGLNRQNALQ